MSSAHHYAAAVSSDDMSPRLFKGESVIFAKDKPPRADSDVFIRLHTGAYLIRELVDIGESGVAVRTYSPDATTVISPEAIAGIYPIVQRCFCSLEELLEQMALPEDCQAHA